MTNGVTLLSVPIGTTIVSSTSFTGTGSGGSIIYQNNVQQQQHESFTTTIDNADIRVVISGNGPTSAQCSGCSLSGTLTVYATYNGERIKFVAE